MITINAGSTALMAQNNLSNTKAALTDNMLQLSTGKRINSAADDAAGLQITNRMETQTNGLQQAQRNANDAISLAQTAEGAMQESTDILNRMNDLALQSANDTNTQADRDAIQKEVGQLQDELNDIAANTNFAGINLLDGSASNMTFQVGTGTEASDTISFSVSDMSASSLEGKVAEYDVAATADGIAWDASSKVAADQSVTVEMAGGDTVDIELTTGMADADVKAAFESALGGTATVAAGTSGAGTIALADTFANVAKVGGTASAGTTLDAKDKSVQDIDLSSRGGATAAVQILEGALAQVDAERAELGAVQNRLESKVDNMSNIEENMGAAKSQMLDADFAKQTTEMTSNQMLMQSGASILSQAKSMPQYATMLLG